MSKYQIFCSLPRGAERLVLAGPFKAAWVGLVLAGEEVGEAVQKKISPEQT